jgi:hypothetical protein
MTSGWAVDIQRRRPRAKSVASSALDKFLVRVPSALFQGNDGDARRAQISKLLMLGEFRVLENQTDAPTFGVADCNTRVPNPVPNLGMCAGKTGKE